MYKTFLYNVLISISSYFSFGLNIAPTNGGLLYMSYRLNTARFVPNILDFVPIKQADLGPVIEFIKRILNL